MHTHGRYEFKLDQLTIALEVEGHVLLLKPRSVCPSVSSTNSHCYNHYCWRKSTQTVRNRFRQCIIRPKRPYVGPVLTNIQRRVRVRWCHILRVWTLRNWCRIWFNGESRFLLQICNGQTGNRCRNECFAPACVQEIDSGQQFPTTAEQNK